MRDGSDPGRWLGRLLPGSVRLWVFEPMYEDLRREAIGRGRRPDSDGLFFLSVVRLVLVAVLFGFPRYFLDRGRVTRAGRALMLAAGGTAVVLVLLLVPWVVTLATTVP